MKRFGILTRYLLPLAALGFTLPSQAEVDGSMAFALDSIWNLERPSVSQISDSFSSKTSKSGTTYRASAHNTPDYLIHGEEAASVLYRYKRFNATQSLWGDLPRLDMEHTRLLELSMPKKRYLAFSGPGKGLFSVTDWQRYSFLHVVDVSTPSAPVYYPLLADAYLGERVLGRLAGSPTLNYARLVPSELDAVGDPSAYEVSLYALNRKGLEPVMQDGHPLAYALTREAGTWEITPIQATPITDAQDQAKRPFTATALRVAPPAAPQVEANAQ